MAPTESAGEPGPGGTLYDTELARFSRLLRTLWSGILSATAAASSDRPMELPLAAHFEDWLRGAGSPVCWWSNVPRAAPFAPPPSAQPGIAEVVLPGELQHTADRLLQYSQLQAQLAMLWNSIIRSAVEKFAAQARSAPAPLELTRVRKLYDSWIDCAEQAYAAVVHTEEYCRTQAALVNVVTDLVLDMHRHVERAARSWGVPTRGEFEALRAQLRELQQPRAGLRGGQKGAGGRKRTDRQKGNVRKNAKDRRKRAVR